MWKDNYKIGIEVIDNQHEELFKRVFSFIKSIRENTDWENNIDHIKETLEFMKEYVIIHFHDEEKYQRDINFPDYEEHKQIHEKFKIEIENYYKKLHNESFKEDLTKEFAGKLMTWLINHVASTDQKIGEFAESQRRELY